MTMVQMKNFKLTIFQLTKTADKTLVIKMTVNKKTGIIMTVTKVDTN